MSKKKLVVVGQGYVGLPLAMEAVRAGYTVVGIDLSERRVAALNDGESFVEDIPNEVVAAAVTDGTYRATSDYAEAAGFDVAVIDVPTPLRESLPDMSFIESAAASIAPHVTKGCLVVLESTTYPGTTEELMVPILEQAVGLTAGVDFHVGYSPERIDPGNQKYTLANTPKVIAGINDSSLQAVSEFFSELVQTTVPVSSPKEAELAKLLENTFRHVNIALVNEIAVFGNKLGINVWEAIDAAATKPFGYMKFTPGPGVGGHCLPVDPSYLSWKVRSQLGQTMRFVELANDVNAAMPNYTVERLTAILNGQKKAVNGSKILVVGLAYKKNTADIRESPAMSIIDLIGEFGGEVWAVDPHVADFAWPDSAKRCDLDEGLAVADAVVIVTDHDVLDYDRIQNSGVPVLDTRNHLAASESVELL